MEISDIQFEGSESTGNVILTFCSTRDWEDKIILKIGISEAWKISKFCQDQLSFGAQLKKLNKNKKR
jgi:hypothetical protein